MPVVKDLVPDLSLAYAQLRSVEPWLKADTPPPPDGERRQSREERAKLDGLWSASCASAVRRPARVTGGTATAPRSGDLAAAYRWISDSRDERPETGSMR